MYRLATMHSVTDGQPYDNYDANSRSHCV